MSLWATCLLGRSCLRGHTCVCPGNWPRFRFVHFPAVFLAAPQGGTKEKRLANVLSLAPQLCRNKQRSLERNSSRGHGASSWQVQEPMGQARRCRGRAGGSVPKRCGLPWQGTLCHLLGPARGASQPHPGWEPGMDMASGCHAGQEQAMWPVRGQSCRLGRVEGSRSCDMEGAGMAVPTPQGGCVRGELHSCPAEVRRPLGVPHLPGEMGTLHTCPCLSFSRKPGAEA